MKSWPTLTALGNSITGASSTADQTLIGQYINDSIRTIATMRKGKWPWLETTETVATVAGQSYVMISQRIRKLTSLLFSGTNIYYPVTPIFDADKWNQVVASRLGSSDVPLFTYIQDRTVNIAPTPATTTNSVIMRGRLNIRDLTAADYTGNISTATSGSTAILGNATTFTAAMVGRYLRITNSATGGDGFWYKIAAYTDATHITLETPYEGTTLAAGSYAFTVGEMSPIPESYDIAPVYRAVALYWASKENFTLANSYWKMYDCGKEAGLLSTSDEPGGLIGAMLEEAAGTMEVSYIPPNGIRMADPNNPPQNLSGF